MATFYIQLQDKLQKISGDLTAANITKALGYTPSAFSGDYNELNNAPITDNSNGEFDIVDESGNIIAKVNNQGVLSVDFVAGVHKLSEKANVTDLPSLEGYAKETWVSEEIAKAVTGGEIDLTGYATEEWVNEQGFIKEHQDISNLATKQELQDLDFYAIKDNPIVNNGDGKLVFADEAGNIGLELDSDNNLIVADVVAGGTHVLSNKADKDEIPSLSGYATEKFVTDKIAEAELGGEDIDLSGYAKKTDLEGLASEQWVESKGYLTEHQDISNLATKDEIPSLDGYAKLDDIPEVPSLDGYATEQWVESKNYATKDEIPSADFNELANNPFTEDTSGELNMTDESGNIGFKLTNQGLYVKDVLAGDNTLSNKVDKVEGKGLSTEDFTTVLKQKLEGLSNYDDTGLSNALSTLRGDFDALVSGDTTTAIKTFNEIIAFLDGIQDTQDLSGIIASIEQQIAGKMDKVTLAAVATSGSYNDLSNKPTIPDVSNKQDKLVSGSNIKTINGNSLLGSGNIAISGGEGGGYDDTEIKGQISEIEATIGDINTILESIING